MLLTIGFHLSNIENILLRRVVSIHTQQNEQPQAKLLQNIVRFFSAPRLKKDLLVDATRGEDEKSG